MGVTLRPGLPLAVAITVLSAAPARAQHWVLTLTPFAGAYVPTKPLGDVAIPAVPNTNFLVESKSGGAFGAKLGLSSRGRRWGLEGTYFLASSKTRTSVGLLSHEDKGEVQGGSLKAVFRVTDGKTDTDFFVSAGVSGQSHSGDVIVLKTSQNKFDVGGVVGLGLHLTLSPQVTFRLDTDASFYSWSYAKGLPSTRQVDFLIAAGLGLKLGR